MTVYFLRHADLIKIGYSSDLTTRMRSLLTAVPGKAEFLGYLPGDRDLESHLHSVFHESRFSGEWFAVSDRLLAIIETLAIKELPAVDVPRVKLRAENTEAWQELSLRVRSAAARKWPDDNHLQRRRHLERLLPNWGSRRVRSLYSAEPGATLRDHEMGDLDRALFSGAAAEVTNT